MNTLQTLMALVVLIFVLAVIVQAVQEFLKSLLNTKAETMKATIVKFMGARLTLPQVEAALKDRGLDITALDHFNKDDFRHLLDGVAGLEPQLKDLVDSTTATFEQKKDNVAAAFEGARASFQKAYAARNKTFALIISFAVVLALNANLLMLYDELAADQVMAQAIVGRAEKTDPGKCSQDNENAPAQSDLAKTYAGNRDCIKATLKNYPILVRWHQLDNKWWVPMWRKDWYDSPFAMFAGLLLMGLLVSLGAPFWNDVLKGMTGVNNALNTGGKKTP
jgi:hypothetical protein